MEQYSTEEQQVEAIKRFWKENGTAIVVGAALGLGGLWGWRYYNEQQISSMENASSAYQQTIESLATGGESLAQAEAFIAANPESGYATLAAFRLAKQAVDSANFEEAAKQLQFVADNAGNKALAAVAKLRLARVQVELQQLDAALVSVDSVTEAAYEAQVQEIKGDVYLQQELFDKARAAYSASLEKDASNPLVQMKLDNLAARVAQNANS